MNTVVQLHGPQYGTIIDYRHDVKWGRYYVVRSDAHGGRPRGAPMWVDSTEFIPVLEEDGRSRMSRLAGRLYRKNMREGSPEQRGCACVCCPHIAGYMDDE